MAGARAKGATIYVTLEPCSHYGRTPPCADLIVESGVERAVIAVVDPNPEVAGRGLQKLQQAGIEVITGLCEREASELNEIFFHYVQSKRPYVTLKSATTLDGKTATVTGKSQWITGKEAREDVHRYRHEHDAILVGVQTVISDDPSLTTRLPQGGKNPIRIVLDRRLRIPETAKMLNDEEAPTWIVTEATASLEKQRLLEQKGASVIRLPAVSITEVLKNLGERNITSLFVEGGAEVHGSFINEKAVQQVVAYIAPKLFAGRTAPTFAGGDGFSEVNEALQLELKLVEQIGEDIKIVAKSKEA